MSNPTLNRLAQATVYTGTNPDGSTYLTSTFPTRVGDLNFDSGKQLERRRATDQPGITTQNKDRFSGDAKQRRAQRRQMARQGKVPGATIKRPNSVPLGKGGKGIGILWALSEGLNMLSNHMVNNDLNTAHEQFDTYDGRLKGIIQTGNETGIIPEQYQTPSILADISNYILQGEFVNSYDAATNSDLTRIAQSLINSNGINCHTCSK